MTGGPRRDIVVIGASAGGVDALRVVVSTLPAELLATVLVVLHLAPGSASALPSILSRAGRLPARLPVDGEEPPLATILVAPPDRHLELSQEGLVRVSVGARENGYRPAVDRLFVTAAARFGARVVGVVLSGALDDGSAGLAAVIEAGGAGLVEDPHEALYPAMPENALRAAPAAAVVPLAEIGERIAALVADGGHDPGQASGGRAPGVDQAPAPSSPDHAQDGMISGFTCPECHGALWEVSEGGVLRFRCRVGHGYSTESLVAEQAVGLEAALWSATRALEERAALLDRLDRRTPPDTYASRRYRREADEARSQSRLVRSAIDRLRPVAETA